MAKARFELGNGGWKATTKKKSTSNSRDVTGKKSRNRPKPTQKDLDDYRAFRR